MTTQPDLHVFVYGTLRRGEANDINRLQPAPHYLGQARIRGALYDLGSYPGVIRGALAGCRVRSMRSLQSWSGSSM